MVEYFPTCNNTVCILYFFRIVAFVLATVMLLLLCSPIKVYAYDGKCEGANYYLCESYQSAGLADIRQGLEDVQPLQG